MNLSKTSALCSLLFCLSLASCGNDSKEGNARIPPPEIAQNIDILRDLNPELRQYLSDPALFSVTRDLGPSIMDARNLPFRSGIAQSEIRPWSAWWYPKKEILTPIEGSLVSALEKYDRVRRYHYGATVRSAADYERRSVTAPPLAWEGLCDAWALASISIPEPKQAISIEIGAARVLFSISDLKALILKTYEAVDDSSLAYYGQKFTGNSDGWVYPDIFPEQFHRFLEVQLFQKKMPFIMDHDGGIEIWNIPVYKANYLVDAVSGYPNAVSVRAWLYSAESTTSQNRNLVGTREAIREYNYVLSGYRNAEDKLVITSGHWTTGPNGVNSRKDHPDYLFKVRDPSQLTRKSSNPEIETAIVDAILSGRAPQ